MKKGLISVILSTFNTDDNQLLLSVESILRQTYQKLELIIIIDGGTVNKCLNTISDKRVKIVKHTKSLGLAARLNEAISLAEGECIARMDSDDYALPDRIEKQYAFMKTNPEIDICSMFAKNFGNSAKARVSACTSDDYIQSELFLNCILVHPTIMFRSKSIKKHDIRYNTNFRCAQDFGLWSSLVQKCRFATLPEIGLFYRVHNKQTTVGKKKEQEHNREIIIQKNIERLGFDEANLKYVEMIQKTASRENLKEACNFIRECVAKNKERQIYNEKAFERVLYRHLFTTLLKNRHYCLCCRIMRPYDILFVFRVVSLTIKSNLKVLKYRKLYNSLLKEKRNAK